MGRIDSDRPTSQIESKNVLDSDKNGNEEKVGGAKKFTPAENDLQVTVDYVYEFIAGEKEDKLKKFIKASCSRFSLGWATAQDVCSQTLIDIVSKVQETAVYQSKFEELCRTIAYRLVIK